MGDANALIRGMQATWDRWPPPTSYFFFFFSLFADLIGLRTMSVSWCSLSSVYH